jgi:hypothetical protein
MDSSASLLDFAVEIDESRYATTHADDRMAERYGFVPTVTEWRNILLAIWDGRSVLSRRDVDGREVHYVSIGRVPVRVVYSPWDAVVITALPLVSRRKYRVKRAPRYREVDDDTL